LILGSFLGFPLGAARDVASKIPVRGGAARSGVLGAELQNGAEIHGAIFWEISERLFSDIPQKSSSVCAPADSCPPLTHVRSGRMAGELKAIPERSRREGTFRGASASTLMNVDSEEVSRG
jgi:hypothetical protein